MTKPVRCISCGEESVTVSEVLGLCGDCIRSDFAKWRSHLAGVHYRIRSADGLPPEVPRTKGGLICRICGNGCAVGERETGYCGLHQVTSEGRLKWVAGSASRARVSWYLDALPTNCVADWVCPGGSACGYPTYSHAQGPEFGFYNLAVFYQACSFDCLFCQNWHYRARRPVARRAAEVVKDVTESVSCICFFGGDPGPQVIHALAVARLARRKRGSGILRICWETNGNLSHKYLDSMVRESLDSGGTIKVDVKTWSEPLGYALSGISNRRSLEIVGRLLRLSKERSEPPLFMASTLLVPGYVDEREVGAIAELIAGLAPETPYSLLAFAPCFWMSDLPPTSRAHAERCAEVARDAGLKRVRIGNRHLLGNHY
jgi:pyruvate formate lyase activating enzyme